MTRTTERRYRQGASTVEVRATTDGGPVIAGYAAVFNSPSEDLGFVESIDPAAFNRTIKQADVRALAQHDSSQLLGRVKNGTLRLSTDQTGLRYEIDINPNDPDGQRALEKVRRGDMDGSSFSFQTIRDDWNMGAQPPERRLLEVALLDVGPVTYPAYSASTAEARSVLDAARLARSPGLAEAQRELELLSLRAGTAPGPASGSLARGPGAPSIGDLQRRVELVGLEVRAGKTISKATAQVLLDIVEKLESLLEDAGAIDPADNPA